MPLQTSSGPERWTFTGRSHRRHTWRPPLGCHCSASYIGRHSTATVRIWSVSAISTAENAIFCQVNWSELSASYASVMTAVPVLCALSFVYSADPFSKRATNFRLPTRLPNSRRPRIAPEDPSPAVWKPEPGKKPESIRMLFFQPVSSETMFLLVT